MVIVMQIGVDVQSLDEAPQDTVYSCKKQPTVLHSSSEAEYQAIANAAADLTWISFLFHDMEIPLHETPQLFCDIMCAIQMPKNPVFHAITKHIELDCHFVREMVALGSLITRYMYVLINNLATYLPNCLQRVPSRIYLINQELAKSLPPV